MDDSRLSRDRATDPEDLISVTTAARDYGVARHQVTYLIQTGKLKAYVGRRFSGLVTTAVSRLELEKVLHAKKVADEQRNEKVVKLLNAGRYVPKGLLRAPGRPAKNRAYNPNNPLILPREVYQPWDLSQATDDDHRDVWLWLEGIADPAVRAAQDALVAARPPRRMDDRSAVRLALVEEVIAEQKRTKAAKEKEEEERFLRSLDAL